MLEDPPRTKVVLERLSAMGIRLSIDDFGTGYSSLAYLTHLPIDEIKIDRSFVMNMVDNEDDATIVRSTIDLGHNLGLKVVAEGVENHDVYCKLASLGCDYAQGYFLSKPLSPEKMSIWLEVFCGMSDADDAKRERRDEQELDRWGITPASVEPRAAEPEASTTPVEPDPED